MQKCPAVLATGLLFAATTIAIARSAEPDVAGEAARHWQELTRLDLEAAYALLDDNHPGMAPELGDAVLSGRVNDGLALARERLQKVDSFYGYRAVLAGFANAASDPHISVRFSLARELTIWPGFLVRMDGDALYVVRAPGDETSIPEEGARLVGCDGTDAMPFAEARLGAFWAVWSIESQRAQSAWRLMINDRNPFTPAPAVCQFEQSESTVAITLNWTQIGATELAPVLIKSKPHAQAGFGVTRLDDGAYWIALGSLDARAEPVLKAAEDVRAKLAAAPFVVVDVRGNSGGSSSYGDRLAEFLFGSEVTADEAEGIEAWRVSADNADAMAAFAQSARQERPDNTELISWAESKAASLRAALAAGKIFDPALPEPLPSAPAFVDPAGGTLGSARVYVLTDYSCFSSCLALVDTFKRRGAVQLGQPTDADTHYMETRQIVLPSRLAVFSTLQKVQLTAAPQIGPYEPALRFHGDIADDAAVVSWVSKVAKGNTAP